MPKKAEKTASFVEKLEAARLKLGGVDRLYGTLYGTSQMISIATLNNWLKGRSTPYANNVKIIEPELDKILAAK